jgi:hypothetical protein
MSCGRPWIIVMDGTFDIINPASGDAQAKKGHKRANVLDQTLARLL